MYHEVMDTPSIDTGIVSVRILFFILPFIIGTFHSLWKKNTLGFSKSDCFLGYFLVIAVGLQGIILGQLEIFHSEVVAAYLGSPNSPFLMEVGYAHFSFGILGILSFWFKNGWRDAAAVGNALFFFLLSMAHLRVWMAAAIPSQNLQLVVIYDLLIAFFLTLLLTLRHIHKSS